MRTQLLQHVPFEGLGSIAGWLEDRGAEVSFTRLSAGDRLPPGDGFDCLIALGGPMSVNDEVTLPWLRAEKQLIREAIARRVPVLGLCLGAQLIASALGARVFRSPVPEIGWFPVQALSPAAPAYRFPPEWTAFHWHGETFDLPAGAVGLARSAACENQAFQVGRRVLGLQFHLETTPDGVEAMVAHCHDDLTPGPFVQTEEELRAVPSAQYAAMHSLMRNVLDYWAEF